MAFDFVMGVIYFYKHAKLDVSACLTESFIRSLRSALNQIRTRFPKS